MIIQSCSEENKQAIFDEFSTNSLGQYLSVDTLDTYSEFCEFFDSSAKQIVSDDESELLMVYKTTLAESPSDFSIILTFMVPLDVCFPSYAKPAVVVAEAVNQIFDDFPDRNLIVCITPNLPFINQALIMAGFEIYEEIIEDMVLKDGSPIDGCYLIKTR